MDERREIITTTTQKRGGENCYLAKSFAKSRPRPRLHNNGDSIPPEPELSSSSSSRCLSKEEVDRYGRSKADKWEWLKLQNVVPICPTKLYISRRVAFFFPFPMVGRWRDFSEKMKYLCPPSLESTRGKFVNTLVEIYRHARRPRENKGGRRRNHTLVVVSFLNFKAEDLQ